MSRKNNMVFLLLSIVTILSLGVSLYYVKVDYFNQNSKIASDKQVIPEGKNEEYIWVSPAVENLMYVNHDVRALQQFGKEKGVRITILGPKDYDVSAQLDAMKEAIRRKPSGILVIAADKRFTDLINKAMDAGIPTITVDADQAQSKRLAYVGSNWFNIGVKQGEAMIRLIGGKGKVAMLGICGAENMEQGFEGFKSVIKDYPDVTLLGEFDDHSSTAQAQKITENLLETHPDIAGIAGFDASSGLGIGSAVKNAKLKGKVKITSVDIEPDHFAMVREGVIQKLIGQKRELFTYFGAKLLYDINHPSISLTANDKKNGVTPIPFIIDTGLVEVDETNVFTIGINER